VSLGPPSGPGIVTFNYPAWISYYPEFGAQVGQSQAQAYFNRATLYCDNTACSPIQDIFQRTLLLNMLVAHIATLFAMLNGQQPRALVGQIDQATEGSVNVHTVYIQPTSDLEAWMNQSPYGAAFWAATAQYRTGFYAPSFRPSGVPGTGIFGPRYFTLK
jgi:hypothetical protein